MNITVQRFNFDNKLRRLAQVLNKSVPDVVKDEARLTAERLTKLTPPKGSKQGRDKVKMDINRVYLTPSWFLETFSFRNRKLDDKVKSAVRSVNETSLQRIFEKSRKLSRLHIEPFTESLINRLRRNGAVAKGIAPFSFPLKDAARVKEYQKKKLKLVGLVKSGWATCAKLLGGSVANWLNRAGTSSVRILNAGFMVHITNKIGYFRDLDVKNNIISTALAGRKKDMATRLNREIKSRTSNLR